MEVRERSAPWRWQTYRGDLVDVNVWVALSFAQHPHHACAKHYWQTTLESHHAEHVSNPEAIEKKIYFCRHTALGMARVLLQTSAKILQPITLADAWATYQRYRLLPEVSFVGESRDGLEFDTAIQSFISSQQSLPIRLWTDMQLASLAQMHGLRVVTFDVDFKRFHLDQLLLLEP
jgi:hypothetical protein